MTCSQCGKELELISELTEDEIKDVSFIETKYSILDEELQNLFGNAKAFKNSEQVSEYFHAVYNQLANNKVLDYLTFNKIVENHHISPSDDIRILDGKIWRHPTE